MTQLSTRRWLAAVACAATLLLATTAPRARTADGGDWIVTWAAKA